MFCGASSDGHINIFRITKQNNYFLTKQLQTVYIQSMFYSFCSVVEAKKREFEHDVHVLEATESTAALNPGRRRFDPEKIVAKYYRSGTSNAFKGAEARSFECLERTLHYILDEIWRPAHVAFEKSQGSWQGASGSSRKMDDLLLRYNFCMDRIAAVRQDITIQRYTCVRTRALLIRIAEFYLNAMVAVNYAPCNGLICNLPPNSFDMKNHEHALNVVLASIQQFTDMSFLNLQTGAIADASSPTPTGYSERSMYYQAVVVTLFLGLCKSISTSYSRATSVAASSDSMADAKKKNVIALDASVGSLMHSYRTELLALVRWRHSDTDSDLTGDALLMGHLQVLATKLLYPMVAYVRQGNPSRAMKVARKYIGTSFGGRESGLSAACESVSWQLGVILFTYALPELRLWRLFLLYATSNVTNHGTVSNKLDQVN